MNDWNDNHHFSNLEKIWMLFCGILVAISISYIVHIYFQFRVVNNEWTQTFHSPEQFWSVVPEWEWKPVFKEQ